MLSRWQGSPMWCPEAPMDKLKCSWGIFRKYYQSSKIVLLMMRTSMHHKATHVHMIRWDKLDFIHSMVISTEIYYLFCQHFDFIMKTVLSHRFCNPVSICSAVIKPYTSLRICFVLVATIERLLLRQVNRSRGLPILVINIPKHLVCENSGVPVVK